MTAWIYTLDGTLNTLREPLTLLDFSTDLDPNFCVRGILQLVVNQWSSLSLSPLIFKKNQSNFLLFLCCLIYEFNLQNEFS